MPSCILLSLPQNYVSCHNNNDDKPLLWPEVEYQILGGPTDNKVIFGQRNGIYIFLLTVVDPYYRCVEGTLWLGDVKER